MVSLNLSRSPAFSTINKEFLKPDFWSMKETFGGVGANVKPKEKTSHRKGIGVYFSVSGEEKTSISGKFNVPVSSDFMSLDEDESTSTFLQAPSASSNSLPLKRSSNPSSLSISSRHVKSNASLESLVHHHQFS